MYAGGHLQLVAQQQLTLELAVTAITPIVLLSPEFPAFFPSLFIIQFLFTFHYYFLVQVLYFI